MQGMRWGVRRKTRGKQMFIKFSGSALFSFAGAIVVSAAVLSGNFIAAFLLGVITVISVYALWVLE
jgi:hypothetical protein